MISVVEADQKWRMEWRARIKRGKRNNLQKNTNDFFVSRREKKSFHGRGGTPFFNIIFGQQMCGWLGGRWEFSGSCSKDGTYERLAVSPTPEGWA